MFIWFLASVAPTVHTTGVNWQSVITIIASVCTILTILGAVVTKFVTNKITVAIKDFQIAVVAKLDTRLTSVEDKLDALVPKRR